MQWSKDFHFKVLIEAVLVELVTIGKVLSVRDCTGIWVFGSSFGTMQTDSIL